MIAIDINKVEKVISEFQTIIDGYNTKAIESLEKIKSSKTYHLTKKEMRFIDRLIFELQSKNIITRSPIEIDSFKSNIEPVPRRSGLRSILFKEYKPLAEHIFTALQYEKRRSDFYPTYFQKLGIKACVYCNSQLAVSVDTINDKNEKKVEAKFQVDHFHPKDKYPYLSISLFNLYPVCATCNNIKRNNAVGFQLYTDKKIEEIESDYKFQLAPGTVAKYLINRKSEEIEFKFNDPDKGDKSEYVKGSLQDTFDIQGIYDTQKDIVEELIVKSEIYNQAYKDTLKKSFPTLLNDVSLSDRIIIGNYSEPHNIHKRPMSKFMQDIAVDLGLYKKDNKPRI